MASTENTQKLPLLFKDRRPNSCFIDQIYDPDIDGIYDPDGPKVIPNEGSTCIDRSTGIIYYAAYIDPKTYKTTLKPGKYLVTGEDDEDSIKIVSYGNDRFMVYYDERVKPTKLEIDTKLILIGTNLAEYSLVRTNKAGEREVISLYVDSPDTFKGSRIPIATINKATGAKKLTNCHTLFDMYPGDTVIAELYDKNGILVAEITLFTKKATIKNNLESENDIIVGFDAFSLQQMGSEFYLYQNQDPSHLGICPRLEYNDGTFDEIVIDNVSCFLYGFEDFQPSYSGQRQKILIKKFLGPKQASTIDIKNGGRRYLTCEKWVNVVANETLPNVKISLCPIWDASQNKYEFKLIAYSDRGDGVYDISDISKYATVVKGDEFDKYQTVVIDVELSEVFDIEGYLSTYRQKIWVKLSPYSEYQKYLISDYEDKSIVYGVESPDVRRPVIHYDETLKQYFIPTNRFMNQAAFLDAFYYKTNPPYNPEVQVVPYVPTHFTIRALDNLTTLITAPLEVGKYQKAWNINRTGNQAMLVGHNVIVEFLQYINGKYQIIFGAPVDVYKSPTGYNTEENKLFGEQ